MFATIGTYGITQSPVDLILLYLIGGIGYLMRRYDFPAAPVIIGMNDGSARRIKATYDFAVQTHATIGPSCAVADFQGGKLTVWTSSQATHSMQHELAVITGLSREAIRLVFIEQQPAQANAAIEADQESRNRVPPVHWYSDPAALSSGAESGPEPWGVVPLPRRPASPRR